MLFALHEETWEEKLMRSEAQICLGLGGDNRATWLKLS